MERREFLIGAAALASVAAARGEQSGVQGWGGPGLAREVAALERESRGRLGVAVVDTHTGARFGHRAGERFAMCSTFKLPLAAAILARADHGALTLDHAVRVPRDLPPNSPTTERRRVASATIAELCEAATTVSDNGAANLLLSLIGGPAGLTRFMRAQGDELTRLDRIEPAMNDVREGDVRDTTTPDAMAQLVRRILLGRALSTESRARLIGWMVATRTGAARLRAGLPAEWRAGDKTGTSGAGHYNDVAIIWPPARAPLIVTAYLAGSPLPTDQANAIHARLGRLIAAHA